MSAEAVDVDEIRAQERKQAGIVKTLKKEGADPADIKAAVEALKKLKITLAEAEAKVKGPEFDIEALEELLISRMFVVPSFEIYNGVAGFYDFGPPACAFKSNLLALWRRHFVLEENMLEIETTDIMPQVVLKTSGHEARFTDFCVKDVKTGTYTRADKLLEDHIDRLLTEEKDPARVAELERIQRMADAFSSEELDGHLKSLGCLSPEGNELSPSFPINLMFRTSIGPEGTSIGYLRPETAQGMFINFARLLKYNNDQMPFAAAQIGKAYRNEISPRNGLIRVREFTMAEIEHFVNATKGKEGKKHPRFASVANTVLNLFPQEQQLTTGKLRQDLTVGEAVAQGIIDNETLGYFLVRTRAFLLKLGIKEEWLRFRQHLKTEMAHYASDCWDAEIFCYTNRWEWIECVGHADRSAYDLTVHEKASKRNLRASYKLDVPEKVDIGEVEYKDPRLLGKTFKKDQLKLKEYLEELGREDTAAALAIGAKLEAEGKATIGPVECLDGRSFEITSEMIAIKKKTITVYERKFLPSVIEPSFGIGRIMNAAFQHNFSVRKGDGEEEEDEEGKGDGKKKKKKKGKKKGKKDERKPCVLSFPPAIAPYQACVLPLSKNEEFFADVNAIEASLRAAGVSTRVDMSGSSIGKRYARFDELGVPFAITVDFETAALKSATVRERDSKRRVRVSLSNIAATISALCKGTKTFQDLISELGEVGGGDAEGGSASGIAVRSFSSLGGAAEGAAAATINLQPTRINGRIAFCKPKM